MSVKSIQCLLATLAAFHVINVVTARADSLEIPKNFNAPQKSLAECSMKYIEDNGKEVTVDFFIAYLSRLPGVDDRLRASDEILDEKAKNFFSLLEDVLVFACLNEARDVVESGKPTEFGYVLSFLLLEPIFRLQVAGGEEFVKSAQSKFNYNKLRKLIMEK